MAEIARLEAELFADAWSSAGLMPYVTGGTGNTGHAAWVLEVVPSGQKAIIPRQRVAGYLLYSWVLDEGSIDRIGVTGEHQRRGIGRVLLEYALSTLRGRGIRQVWLEVGASNEAAIRLYEAVGFSIVSRRTGYYVGPPADDALVMNKVIE